MTDRQPIPRSTAKAIQQAAEHINEVDAVLDDWYNRNVLPAALSSDYFEMRFRIQAALRWLQAHGAKVLPDEIEM